MSLHTSIVDIFKHAYILGVFVQPVVIQYITLHPEVHHLVVKFYLGAALLSKC
jgi:hypothetical protein